MSNDTQPEIRFPGFTEDWEQRKFFDNIKNTIDFRGRTPKKLGMDWSESGYLALSALNVKNGYIDPSADAHYGNQDLYDKWMVGKELYEGQVLFTTEAPMGNVAQVPDNNKYILSQRTIAFDVNSDKITNDFLAVLLRTPKSFNELSSLASGGTAKGVSQKSLSQFQVTLPKNLEEQKKIGTFFKQLDNAIALHQRKLDLLKETKKGFLQKMFPKNGAKVPEIRFPGFTEDWEERRLQEVVDRYDNLRIPITASKRVAGNTPYYGANGIQGYVEGYTHDGEFILVAEDGANDLKNYPVQYVDGKVWVNNHAHVIQAKENLADNMFLMNAIRSINIEPFLVGGGRAKLNADVLMKLEVIIPLKSEQQKIGAFFKQLDDTIALHQRKLDLLKETKKGFLQKMFV
ncbi:restriction endonuclease subunit S [Enterococcus faecalis]|uniref:restriction endonuclease subunit S n=1 Tax=Enterococcus faecalis TaxID=1351 RepID=UPI0021E98D5F|nr:restriction endonuclease subunit S [Enterococcus faecalis]MCV3143277.1 restriction endonuclease subunit S [Enterococcus faecalis]